MQVVVPQGIQSVNGSDVNMGCRSLVERDGLMVCDNSESYLVDGCSPTIDTSTSNWASQLVTVKKMEANDVINAKHVLLTFDFDTAVSPTSIELDMFLCPEWNIGAHFIYVYGNQTSNLVLNSIYENLLGTKELSRSSCDSLSTVSIHLRDVSSGLFYHSWHIVMDFASTPDIKWVHVGEVRFLDVSTGNHNSCSYTGTSRPSPGKYCITHCLCILGSSYLQSREGKYSISLAQVVPFTIHSTYSGYPFVSIST